MTSRPDHVRDEYTQTLSGDEYAKIIEIRTVSTNQEHQTKTQVSFDVAADAVSGAFVLEKAGQSNLDNVLRGLTFADRPRVG